MLYKLRWRIELFLIDQGPPPDQALLRYKSQRGEDPDMDHGVHLLMIAILHKRLKLPHTPKNFTGFERSSV